MHARIFQIDNEPIDLENEFSVLNEDSLECGDGMVDYCCDLDEEDRMDSIKELFKWTIPDGMFTLSEDCNSMTYNGGFEKWREGYAKQIQEVAKMVTPENSLDCLGPVWKLRQLSENPLDTDHLFYLCGDSTQTYAERSIELISMISRLKVGDKLYFGGVLDYHF